MTKKTISKEDKLAAKLRENLKRRKSQTKSRLGRDTQAAPATPSPLPRTQETS